MRVVERREGTVRGRKVGEKGEESTKGVEEGVSKEGGSYKNTEC